VSHDDPDVCVIGCGPAGTVLGAHLVEHGVRVTVLEAGPRHPFAARRGAQRALLAGMDPWERTPESLDVASSGGAVPYDLRGLRVRGVGGSTLHWDAETPRFQAVDFRLRSTHGVGVDWPLDYATLEPYYAWAERELGVAGGEAPHASPRSGPYPLSPLPCNHLDQMVMRVAAPLGLRFTPVPQARNSRPYAARKRHLHSLLEHP
jgi:choline dehydrogenase-like flavoprotein